MANTVVSIFREAGQAEKARKNLIADGFADSQVTIKTATYNSDDPVPDSGADSNDILEKITSFFRELFGADDDEVDQYAHAGQQGTIVTVHTDTSEEAEKVAAILDFYGAEHATETSGSYSGEDVTHTGGQELMDMPSHASRDHSAPMDPRAFQLRARIVARAVENRSRDQY